MKKLIMFTVLSLFTTAAYAWPTVGDSANYDVAVRGSSSGTGTVSLVTKAINESQDQVTIGITITYGGQTNAQDKAAKLSELKNAASALPGMVADCASNGGTNESITNPAGTFNTCKMADDSSDQKGFIWYADIVYGWVKQSHTDNNGQTTDITLNSYHAN